MQDFALLDDELERLDATLGWSPIASTSALGLPVPTAPQPQPPTPSPLAIALPATAGALQPSSSATNTPKAASPAPLPAPPLSAEQGRLTSLVRSLNPAAPTPVAMPQADKPPDALWWETLATASSSGLGMPRCSFANHVEGDTSPVDVVVKSSKGKGKAKANGTANGRKAGEKARKSLAPNGTGKCGAKGKGRAKAKAPNGIPPARGLGVRMRRNFETLKQIRRLHGKLANGARGPDVRQVIPL